MIGRFARRIPVSLADLAQQYLAQPLPDISGIFQPREDAPVEDDPVEETTPGITPQLLQQTGGDNFSVYNPDPTRLRTADDYSPFNARRYYARPDSDVGIPSGILSDSKFLYGDQVRLPGILGMGQEFLKKVMPVNRRAILENEALGSGIRLDDIGRVVAGPGDINTAENIMAGYNLAKVTPETIQKRRDMINAKMKDPEQKAAKLKALDDFENMMFGTGGITDLSDGIFDQKSKIKDPTYKTLDEAIAAGLAEGDDDDDDFNIEDFIAATNPNQIPTGITAASFPGVGLNRRDIIQDIGIQNVRDAIERGRERDRQRQIEIEKMAKKKRDIQQYTGGGGGDNNSGGGGGNIGSDGADYSSAAETGAKAGFSYGL